MGNESQSKGMPSLEELQRMAAQSRVDAVQRQYGKVLKNVHLPESFAANKATKGEAGGSKANPRTKAGGAEGKIVDFTIG